jgi:hypothetical protein
MELVADVLAEKLTTVGYISQAESDSDLFPIVTYCSWGEIS